MSLVIDIIIVAIFAVCILIGYMKGLTQSLIKIVSFILALIVAFVFFKPISNLIIDHTNWDENLEQSIRQVVLESDGEEQQESSSKQNLPDIIVNYINESVEKAGNEAKTAIVDATAKDVTVTIINGAVLVSLFLITRIVLIFIKGIAKILTNLPVIKQFDKLGGVIYGLLESLVIVYVILALVSFISPMLSQTNIIQGIQSSFLGSVFYNNNLLLKLFF